MLSCTSTHIQLTDNTGNPMVKTSCGTEGFKNSKKSTPIAAQTAGISAAAVSSHLLRCRHTVKDKASVQCPTALRLEGLTLSMDSKQNRHLCQIPCHKNIFSLCFVIYFFLNWRLEIKEVEIFRRLPLQFIYTTQIVVS